VKELFLPSGNSETPLSIYGALAFGYSHILGNAATAANGAGRPAPELVADVLQVVPLKERIPADKDKGPGDKAPPPPDPKPPG